jgi:hypothetical protein
MKQAHDPSIGRLLNYVITKDLAPDRKKIPGVLGIPGYRGNREIPSGYRTNSKSKIQIQREYSLKLYRIFAKI